MHRYRQIHTTSTKCQYHAAASNPKWWPAEKWWAQVRIKQIVRNEDPIRTWRPWNPVATKNVVPYTLSAMVKGATMYSPAWRNVKYPPKQTVSNRAWRASVRLPSINLWWAQVTVTPDARRTAVFRRGTLNGLSGLMPEGGQEHPISGVGDRLLWKNAQKKAKKNITSEVINKIIPHRRPVVTWLVWWPRKVPSRITSRHHWTIEIIIRIEATIRQVVPWLWNHLAKPIARVKAPMDEVRGHGLYSTRWKGWRIIYVFYLIIFLLGR